MQTPDRITLVLRACEAASLASILPFVKLGEMVSVGRGLAVIAGASEGDLMSPSLEREQCDIAGQARLVADAKAYRVLRDSGCLIYRDKDILSVTGGTFILGADGLSRPQAAERGTQEQQP
ncbi:TPA: hypothetical protein U8203_004003 [Pseudomonas putida]|nr:hypothetical protein [Pseudomonas putida]HEN8718651.1 hypothetical protein [Pseudomonas putida]